MVDELRSLSVDCWTGKDSNLKRIIDAEMQLAVRSAYDHGINLIVVGPLGALKEKLNPCS